MKDEDYDQEAARHYAAYRPPLHAAILALGLKDEERFGQALDVGCGTGNSTHALRAWCPNVIGTDPSMAMIERTKALPGVSFRHQPGEDIDAGLDGTTFDLITFAGSLFYLHNPVVLTSLKGLLVPGATVIVYDFDVLLQPVFNLLGVSMPRSDYDHAKNLSDVASNVLHLMKTAVEDISFVLNATQLAHLLFSVSSWRKGPLANYEFSQLVHLLPKTTTLKAKTWLTRYAF
ncbi:MAG: methyltransferase domain-containing protein [Lewinella sp.]